MPCSTEDQGCFGPRVFHFGLNEAALHRVQLNKQKDKSLQVLFLSPAWGRVLSAQGELFSSSVCQALRTLVRKRLFKYKVLLRIMFCSSRKELLSYKSPEPVHSGLDSGVHKLQMLFGYN